MNVLLILSISLAFAFGQDAEKADSCRAKGGRCMKIFSNCNGVEHFWGHCRFYEKCCVPKYPQSTTKRPTGPVVSRTPPPSLANSTCGRSQVTATHQRIVGGGTASRGAWPWQISLRRSGRHSCGGSVVGDQWVVSAAHCFARDKNLRNYKVRVGEHDFNVNDGNHADHSIAKLITHPTWVGMTGSVIGDLVLVKLSTKINIASRYVNHVCLPRKGTNFVGHTDCWVTGWGMTHPTIQVLPNKLQELNEKVITNQQCNQWSYGWGGRVKSTQICMGDGRGTGQACKGDSGGPLVCGFSKQFQLAGIVSWGSSNCAGKPVVFTRVSEYTDWIERQMSIYS